jgi:TonB family protein
MSLFCFLSPKAKETKKIAVSTHVNFKIPKNNNSKKFNKLGVKSHQVLSSTQISLKSEQGPTKLFLAKKAMLINNNIHVEYPLKARRQRREGRVCLRLLVSREGHVIDISVVKSPSADLEHAAIKFAYKLVFTPATNDEGHAEQSYVEHDVVFRLINSS